MTARKTAARRFAALVVVLAAVAAGAYLALRATPSSAPTALVPVARPAGVVVLSPAAQQQAGIEVAAVSLTQWSDRLQAPGVLALNETHTARLGSPVDGKVLSVLAFVGDRVDSGQPLALLESPVVHDAWAAYRKGRAELRRAETELSFSVQTEQRARRLFEAKAVSRQEVERTGVERVAAEQSLDMARTELRRAEEAMEHLGITSGDDPTGESGEDIPIRSPLAGAVLERFVTAGTGVTTGLPLFVVSDLSTLWASAELDETLLPRVRVGMPVEIQVASYPNETFAGSVIFVADRLDPKTRRIAVRCSVPNAEGRLKAEMFATLVFRDATARAALTLPAAAVQDIDGMPTVFVREGSETFRPRAVTLGETQDARIEVQRGLQVDEAVAVAGSFALKAELLKGEATEEE